LVRGNLHYVYMDSDLYRVLIEFIRHVSVYESIRTSGEECNPIDVGAPFPPELEKFVKKEYKETISRYEQLVKTPNKSINYVPSAPDTQKARAGY
jgi:hypothetical protein